MDDVTMVLGGTMPAVLEALGFTFECRGGLKVLGWSLSVDQTVARVREWGPDVVLLCADVAEWDGVQACAEIKRLQSDTRVVVIGAEGDQTTLLSAVKAGADGFVTVADPIDDVVGAVRQVSRGESRVPPTMLGTLLRGLIQFRREDDAAVERFASLGKREREVLFQIVAGLDSQAIASKLHLSPHTARTHTQNILLKLGVHSRLDAARFVFDHDLLSRFGEDPGDK